TMDPPAARLAAAPHKKRSRPHNASGYMGVTGRTYRRSTIISSPQRKGRQSVAFWSQSIPATAVICNAHAQVRPNGRFDALFGVIFSYRRSKSFNAVATLPPGFATSRRDRLIDTDRAIAWARGRGLNG